MGLWRKLFGSSGEKQSAPLPTPGKRQGPLVHVFVFDTGPILQEESKYVTNVVRSLLPEALGYHHVPLTFFTDENMPQAIGQGKAPDLKRAMSYHSAWMRIGMKSKKLVVGISPEKDRYTFTWEEYHSDWGNRGILYAFYELVD